MKPILSLLALLLLAGIVNAHSPVAAESRIYFVGDNGETTVIKAGPAFEVLAKNPFDQMVQASPAISQGQLFIRTAQHLFAIGRK